MFVLGSAMDAYAGSEIEYGKIHGQKYEDVNLNGQWDDGEPYLNGWIVFFDENGNKTFDAGENDRVTHDDPYGNPGHYWFTSLLPGDYTVCETLPGDWVQTQPGTPEEPQCYELTIDESGTEFEDVDFGNFDTANGGASLTVIKEVINDNGGTAVPANFTINVANPLIDTTSFAGASGEGVTIIIGAGETIVTEDSFSGYTGDGGLGDCNFVAVIGQEYTCTITNDDDAPSLTVIKEVINDNGGTSNASDFTINVDNPLFDTTSFAGASGEGVTIELSAGETNVTEYLTSGYAGDGGLGDCNFVAELGAQYTCTITNNDIAPGLTLQMVLVLDDNLVGVPGDFVLSASGPTGFSGPGPIVESGAGISAGTYSLSATGSNYFNYGEWTCVDDLRATSNTVSVNVGDAKLCTIIIDDKLNSDLDLIPNEFDNCPDVTNQDQYDIDGDGIGDLCEPATGDNEWDSRPTFGVNHETRGTMMVENGFVFNDNSFTLTDNHHTPFDQQIIEIGAVNSFAATVYADKDLKVQEFLFGIPQVGLGHLAEMRVEVWYGVDGQIEDVKVLQDTEVIDRDTLSITHQKSKCLDSDTETNCDTTKMSAVFLEPLADNVMALKAMDFKLRDQTTYLNDGFDISGDSLNPMVTKMIPSSMKGEGLVEVTQNQKYSNYWSAADGRIFEQNDFGSFKQINQSFERFQDAGNAFNRAHSDFGKIVDYEQNRALKVFDATGLESQLPDSFSYEFKNTERISDEVIQEMIIQEHLAQKILDSMNQQSRWN